MFLNESFESKAHLHAIENEYATLIEAFDMITEALNTSKVIVLEAGDNEKVMQDVEKYVHDTKKYLASVDKVEELYKQEEAWAKIVLGAILIGFLAMMVGAGLSAVSGVAGALVIILGVVSMLVGAIYASLIESSQMERYKHLPRLKNFYTKLVAAESKCKDPQHKKSIQKLSSKVEDYIEALENEEHQRTVQHQKNVEYQQAQTNYELRQMRNEMREDRRRRENSGTTTRTTTTYYY